MGTPARLIGETPYQAGSWPTARRVVYTLANGPNTRFVVTSRTAAAAAVYAWYTDRGEPENRVPPGRKDLKRACFADLLSDCRFYANQFRLLLHAAYWLLDTVRRWLVRLDVPRLQLDTLRLRLVTIGG